MDTISDINDDFMDEGTIYVLDSTVFLEKYSDGFSDKACVTVYEVSEEIKDPYAKIQFDMLVQSGLSILSPKDEFVKVVTDKLNESGDKLSGTDISVIALALEFSKKGKKVLIVTDDYGIQNTSKSLGLKFMAMSQKGISRILKWRRKCTACGADTDKEICDICGSETKFVSSPRKKR
ncbi:MAG: ribonuclease VapC [Nanohaloarchaea archaeon]|nr:ribonuclease VapC [Candidatus Nanohaloarchaea archaeon]